MLPDGKIREFVNANEKIFPVCGVNSYVKYLFYLRGNWRLAYLLFFRMPGIFGSRACLTVCDNFAGNFAIFGK